MKKYSIDQFPKNKNINNLSLEQTELRKNSVLFTYDKEIECRVCLKTQSISEFYVIDKNTGRRATKCRDCTLKHKGVIEIGKQRFAFKIADKGFRRCSVCKEIKPLTDYSKNKKQYLGISNNCCECSHKLHANFQKQQHETIGLSYIKEYGKLKGISVFTDDVIELLKLEIIERRKPKYFLDELNFNSAYELARYILTKYGLPITTTLKRIDIGFNEKDCTISEFDFRSAGQKKAWIKRKNKLK